MPIDILITGIPRGGTTLAGALLDSLPDTVCLSEPAPHWHVDTGGTLNCGPDPDGSIFSRWLIGEFSSIRAQISRREVVPDRRQPDGQSPTNYHPNQAGPAIVTGALPGGLPENFTLGIKHNGPYLTCLPELVSLRHFRILAIVRHPVATILSWQRLNLPVSRGHMHDAARCWPEMQQAQKLPELLERQVKIYDLICQRLTALGDAIAVLRYEDLVAQPQLLAERLALDGQVTADRIEPAAPIIDPAAIAPIVRAFNRHAGAYRAFYPDPLDQIAIS